MRVLPTARAEPDLVPRRTAATIEPRPTRGGGSDHAAITIELAP